MGNQTQDNGKESLDRGDGIEFALTLEVDTGSGKAWPKYGSRTRVRPDETTEEADRRLEEHVIRRIEEIIKNASS